MSKRDWCNIPVSVPWRSTGHFRDLQIWLIDNIDSLDWNIEGADYNNLDNRIVNFAYERDAVLFALRWT